MISHEGQHEEQRTNLEIPDGVVLGDMPNLEGIMNPELSALENIDDAIQAADRQGEGLYGKENWQLINAK